MYFHASLRESNGGILTDHTEVGRSETPISFDVGRLSVRNA
jgi:hypothetical protein